MIGLSTYAFFWQWQPSADAPLSLEQMLDRTAGAGVRLFQVCDYPPLAELDGRRLDALRSHAEGLGVTLELGTRGIGAEHLQRHLEIAQRLGAGVVRSMLTTAGSRPTPEQAVGLLAAAAERYQPAGVVLALETYEQVPVATLVEVVRAVGSPAVGICLDPANCVAALEHPRQTIALTAPHVRNVHVKDFCFTRSEGWVGFNLVGCPLGEGLLPYAELVAAVRPEERGISQVIEHWLPWQGDSSSTIRLEQSWTEHNLSYLRSRP